VAPDDLLVDVLVDHGVGADALRSGGARVMSTPTPKKNQRPQAFTLHINTNQQHALTCWRTAVYCTSLRSFLCWGCFRVREAAGQNTQRLIWRQKARLLAHLMAAIMTVLELPPKLSFSNHVNGESLKGTCTCTTTHS
jgi:hypothetical protein